MGATVINTKPTKIYEDKPNSFIDHLITNYPQKILHHKVLDHAFSDHLMVLFTISNKKVINHQKYRIIRKFEQIDWDQLNAELATDQRIQLAETSDDANIICDTIINTVNELMDRQQPTKRVQISNKIPEFASETTKETMKDRDEAMTKMKTTKNHDDIRNYRMLRNRVHTLLHQDKEKYIKDKFDQVEGRSRQQWKTAKEQAGWTKQLSPEMLVQDGKTIRQPKEMADLINFAQISRNTTLHRDVPKTSTDSWEKP